MSERNEDLWTFKYEPQCLSDYIADEETKIKLKKIIEDNPNIIMAGSPGIGKSTFANIFLKETQYDYLKINASAPAQNGIGMIENKIIPFVNSLGTTKFKIVIFNEAERLTTDAQESLRQLMEDVQLHTRFIFICNSYREIHDAILSRCNFLEISHPPAEKIFEFCSFILDKEKIQVSNKKQIVKIIKNLYPDIRRIVNTIQGSIVNGKLNEILLNNENKLYDNLLDCFFKKDLNAVRTLLRNNSIIYTELYSMLFDNIDKFNSAGDAIILIGEYLYRHRFVAIPEINFMAMFVRMIKEGIL